jgi:hypothetical protein
MERIFELDAAVSDTDLGIGLLWKGLKVTAIDGPPPSGPPANL